MAKEQTPRKQDADRLYEQFVRPLEKEHEGQYVTVDLAGATLISPTLLEALQRADEVFGPKHTITFQVGDKVVGRI